MHLYVSGKKIYMEMNKTNDFQWNFENTLLTLGQDEIFSNAECKVSYNCK